MVHNNLKSGVCSIKETKDRMAGKVLDTSMSKLPFGKIDGVIFKL